MSPALIVAAVVALLHIYIFYMESIAWGTARVNRAFQVSEQDAKIMKSMALNQGFYNLFLAVAIILGLGLIRTDRTVQGEVLIDYAVLSVAAAALVLLISRPQNWRGAAIQGVPAVLYFVIKFV